MASCGVEFCLSFNSYIHGDGAECVVRSVIGTIAASILSSLCYTLPIIRETNNTYTSYTLLPALTNIEEYLACKAHVGLYTTPDRLPANF